MVGVFLFLLGLLIGAAAMYIYLDLSGRMKDYKSM